MKKVLITGALGQIGTELAFKMSALYGESNIIISDIIRKEDNEACQKFTFEILDTTNKETMINIINKHKITYIVHLASILSATGEQNPQRLWDINMGGLYNVLEIAREKNIGVFTPSSIAAFGSTTPVDNTPQDTIQRPSTIYGISKVAGELLCDYYFHRYNVDTRGVRFPGLISYKVPPGGGTTDYAVEIYYQALQNKKYTCPLKENTYMDMMYMDDATNAIIQLIEADGSKLIHRNAFNISAMSFSPKEIYAEIKKHIPEFVMDYQLNPNLQKIADGWPNSIDYSDAVKEWGFTTKFDLSSMTITMLDQLKIKLNI